MDLATGSAAGAVACPVCTLYLREGISLQRHLDTHPKEQVIEALIRASSAGQGQAPPVQTPLVQAQPPPSPQGPVPAAPPTPTQAQYPMGLFECPPIMQPQFASFSYQQFVNNGTMMIPQYAMAPQNNQMMQMFYNPYGMYQHQQVPTVQMISPIAPMPATTTMTTMSTMTTRFRATSSTIEVPRTVSTPSTETIIREPMEPMQETSLVPDMEPPASPQQPIQTMPAKDDEHTEEKDCNQQGEEQVSGEREQGTRERESVVIVASGQEEGESILPEIDENRIAEPVSPHNRQYYYPNEYCNRKDRDDREQMQQATIRNDTGANETAVNGILETDNSEEKKDIEAAEESDLQQLSHINKSVAEIITPDTPTEEEEEEDEQDDENEIEMERNMMPEPSESLYKETQVQDEQLERLLTNIIESELQHQHNEGLMVETQNKNEDVIRNELEEMTISTTIVNNQNSDNSYYPTHSYRKSQSMPSSPVTLKKYHRTTSRVSLCSDLDSVDNLCVYPVDFDTNALQDSAYEERFDRIKDGMEVNDKFRDPYEDAETMDDATAERLISQTQGKGSYCADQTSELKSTNLIDSNKPCSPASVRSFCNVEIDNSTRDAEDFSQVDSMVENVPIDCSKPEKEKQTEYQKANESSGEDNFVDEKIMNHEDEVSAENSFSARSYPVNIEHESPMVSTSYPLHELENSHNIMNLTESAEPLTSLDLTRGFHISKSQVQKPSAELLNISEDAHVGPVNVFEFDGLQILVPSTFISDSSQKAVSGTSQQSMASSECGTGIDEEIKSVNMRADESMPSRGELSEQESNGCTEQSAWQLYMGQESSRVSTSYDLMARESWEESEGSDNEASPEVPLLDSRSLATHFASSLFLDRDRKTPTRRTFKCSYCVEIFECPKERRVHITTIHKEASSSGRSGSSSEQHEVKDIKLLDGRTNVFEDIFSPGLHVPQVYHQQPLLHQLQPPQRCIAPKSEADPKIDGMGTATEVTCPVCNQRFASEKSFQMHRRRMHDMTISKRIREVSKCQICQEEFPSVMLFNSHLKIHPLECGQCGKYFYRKQNFKLHMKRHLGIKPFACTTCDKAFLTKQKLDEHMNGHTGNAPVKCNLCNETFRRYSNLTQHKNRHHLNIKKKLKDYICHCGEVFHTKKKLAWHKETHDEKPKACTYCNERFIHMASLTRHMRRAHNRRFVPDAQREVENVECPICKCIYLRSSLAVHMRVHNGERPYECQVCSKAFSTKWNLQLHKWTHAARSAKPFKCNQCSAAFYRHSDYTAHMNSHRNVRPYTCNYCGAQFIRKYNCLRHVKEHEENKAHTCEICKKTFHRSYYLKEHLRVHSGARPYSCHICGKSSSTKSNHNKHVRIHHAREPVNTEN